MIRTHVSAPERAEYEVARIRPIQDAETSSTRW